MEDRLTTYRGVRIDDTTEWKLVVYISDKGMSAYLKNIENPLEPVVTLFEDKWVREESGLLHRIETAIYDHPQLLDDFSTQIAMCSPRTQLIPEKVAQDSEDISRLYNMIYKADEDDIFVDQFDGIVCAYTLSPGLQSFLRRTLSGARVVSHMGVEIRRFMQRGADMPRLYVDVRENEADFILIDDRKLLLGATHEWHVKEDLVYHVLNIIDVYGLDAANTQVSISGLREIKTELMKMLRERVGYAMLTMMPSAVSKLDMPLGAALAMRL